jgi:hypothetical protein
VKNKKTKCCKKNKCKQKNKIGSGKGDNPRNIFSNDYRENYDKIFRKKSPNIEKNIRKKAED